MKRKTKRTKKRNAKRDHIALIAESQRRRDPLWNFVSRWSPDDKETDSAKLLPPNPFLELHK